MKSILRRICMLCVFATMYGTTAVASHAERRSSHDSAVRSDAAGLSSFVAGSFAGSFAGSIDTLNSGAAAISATGDSDSRDANGDRPEDGASDNAADDDETATLKKWPWKRDYEATAAEFSRAMKSYLDPLPDRVYRERDVVYCRVAGQDLLLDVYQPKVRPLQPMPAILYVHGGGWRFGDKGRQAAMFIDLAMRGYTVFTVNYRLSGQATFPACMVDCRTALRWVRAHAEQYRIDPERIGLMGSSAGGHIVALMALAGDRSFRSGEYPQQHHRVSVVVSFYGVYDLRGTGHGIANKLVTDFLGASEDERPDVYRTASPLAYLEQIGKERRVGGRTLPPFLLLHGDADRIVSIEQSRVFDRMLRKLEFSSELIEIHGGVHGLLMGQMDPTPDEFRARVYAFLDAQLRPSLVEQP